MSNVRWGRFSALLQTYVHENVVHIFCWCSSSGVLGTISVLVFLLATLLSAGIISRVNSMPAGMFAGFQPPAGGNATNGTAAPE